MMKELLNIILLIVILSFGAYAQEVEKNEWSEFSSNKIIQPNYFSIGWANLGIHFSPNEQNYSDLEHNILSPGFELQLSYHFRNKFVLTSGVNYQTLYFNTRLKTNETNRPEQIKSAFMRDLSIPLLLKYNFLEFNSVYQLGVTSGIYYSIPLFAQYTVSNKIYGGGGYDASSITNTLSGNYSSVYLGICLSKTIHSKYELYLEPLLSYQLNENFAMDARNRFWFGLKAGINYSFKKLNK